MAPGAALSCRRNEKMRKICLLLTVLLLVSLLPLAASAESFSFVIARNDTLLFASLYDWESPCNKTVRAGDILYATGDMVSYYNYTWYGVLYDGAYYYICSDFADLYSNIDVFYTTADLAMRSAPGTSNRKLRTLPTGTRLNITGFGWDDDGTLWFQVYYGSSYGYMSSRYTSLFYSGSTSAPYNPSYHYNNYSASRYATLKESKLASRSGPSTKYYETGSFLKQGSQVELFSRVYDKVNEIWWVQAEVQTSRGAMRVYTGSWRFYSFDLYSLYEESLLTTTRLKYSAQLMCGPGSNYAAYSNAYLYSGTQVDVYAYENGWAQIECRINDLPYRGWVKTSALQ